MNFNIQPPMLPVQKDEEDWKWQPQVEATFTPPPKLLACRRVRGAKEFGMEHVLLPDTLRGSSAAKAGVRVSNEIVRVVAVGPDVSLKAGDRPIERGDLLVLAPGVSFYRVNLTLNKADEQLVVNEGGLLGAIPHGSDLALLIDKDPDANNS